jgi:hypothetical protein
MGSKAVPGMDLQEGFLNMRLFLQGQRYNCQRIPMVAHTRVLPHTTTGYGNHDLKHVLPTTLRSAFRR